MAEENKVKLEDEKLSPNFSSLVMGTPGLMDKESDKKKDDKELSDADKLYVLDIYKKLDQAQQDGDEAAQLKAFKALQNFYISQETYFDKVKVGGEAAMEGINKGIATGIGLPVDISNLILSMGEMGVKAVMDEIGFEVSPDASIVSDKPFLGGKQIEDLFNKVGIETDYDKTRLLTAITGRIAEEVGINIPLMGFVVKGATPKNMGKIGAFELSAATSAGAGGAWGQQIDKNSELKYPGTNIPVNLEAWGMALGYTSPITVSSTLKFLDSKVGLKSAYDQIFRPHTAASKAAASILFSRMDESQINKLLTDIERKDMTAEQLKQKFGLEEDEMSILFGDSINQTNFPRSLDQILGGEDLARLKEQIMKDPNGLALAQSLDAYKYTRLIHMENTLRGKLMSEDYAKGDVIPGSVSLAVENRIAGINNYVSSRVALAEQIAAEKMALIGPNINRADATKILKVELEEALSDMLRQEQLLWGKVRSKVDGTNIGDGAMEILFSQFKTTPRDSIPPLLKRLVGEERLAEAGLIEVAEGAKLQPGLLDGKQSANELLNLKALIHDEIRKASKLGTRQGDLLAYNYSKLVDDVDEALLTGVTEKNIEKANTALSYSNKIQTDIYDSSIGNLLEYSITKGNPAIINAKKFEELITKGESGGITSGDFLKVLDGESTALQEKIKDDVARLIDPRNGQLPARSLEKYILNNQELINQFPQLKAQLLDADAAKVLVEDRLLLQARTEKDLAKYRSNTILSDKDLGLSNNTIIKNIFNPKAIKEDQIQAIDNIVTVLNRSDESGLALQGFQDSLTEYIFNTIKPVQKGGKKTIDLKTTTSFIENNRDLLVKVYGEEGAKMWDEFNRVLIDVEPALLKGNVGKLDIFSKQNVFISSIGRILGAKAGSMGVGPPLVLAGLGGRAANAMLSGKTQAETIRILSKAYRDPEFAAELIKPLADEVDARIFEDQLQQTIDVTEPFDLSNQVIIFNKINRFIKDDNAVLTTTTRVGTESAKESEERLREEQSTIEAEPQANLGVPIDVSRLGQTNITPPVSMAAADPNIMDRGKQLFGGPREITFASKGGIMNARKVMQRVI
jgi:hypothetical protein